MRAGLSSRRTEISVVDCATNRGRLVGTCAVPDTGGAQQWATASCPVKDAAGVHDLFFVFAGGGAHPFAVDWWQFE